MATVDSAIGNLPPAQSFDDNSLLVAEQSAEAVKVTGAQLKAYASAAGASAAQPYATAAATSAETAAQWATGNTSGTPSATNNGKYYSEQAAGYAATAASWSANPPYIGTNGNWYVWNTTTEQYEDSGVDASITVDIADITELAAGATPYVTNTGTPTDPIFHLFIPAANGITSISKTGTSGLTDTYTISYTDGTSDTFTVTNGANGGFSPQIKVTAPTGSTVTISKGGTTITGTEQSGVWYIDVPDYGNWTVTATKSGQTFTDTVSVTEVKQYEVEVFYVSGTLESNSWADISKIARKGIGANYWSVGDTKTVALSGTVGTLDVTGSYKVFIIGFNHKGEKGITFQGFKTTGGTDVCLCDSYYGQYQKYDGTKYFQHNHWDPSNYGKNYGGWKGSEMRYDILGSTNNPPTGYGSANSDTGRTGYDAGATTPTSPVANTLMAALPSALRAVLRPMTVYTDNVGNSSNVNDHISASVDYLPLLAEFEIFGARTYANEYEQNYQAQYDYYKNGNSKVKYKHAETSTAAAWWGRSPRATNDSDFCYVTSSGAAHAAGASWSLGLAPAFML